MKPGSCPEFERHQRHMSSQQTCERCNPACHAICLHREAAERRAEAQGLAGMAERNAALTADLAAAREQGLQLSWACRSSEMYSPAGAAIPQRV